VDEEPKYLRRQKPLEIKRRKFGRKAWTTYFRVTMWIGAGVASGWLAYSGGRFLLTSPAVRLLHPEQVEITGNFFVPRATVLEIFAPDRGKSILRIPIEQRRHQLEAVSWIESATVRRALPNKIQVEITERTPVAFLRQGTDMLLVDAHGVILERPLRADFHFPVVTGISMDMPLDQRARRMQLFSGFSDQLEESRAGALEQVSEVDLSDANDLVATIDGPPKSDTSWGQDTGPIVVHFGDTDFGGKYATLLDNIRQWRATAGRIESVDLRFSREAVVNPEIAAVTQQVQPAPAQGAVQANANRQPRHSDSVQAHPKRKTGAGHAR
jgi:cell division protein FtsQ